MRVIEAANGERLQSGTVYIAPGGRHMIVERQGGALHTALRDGPGRVVILDLTRVSLLASAGLTAMWEARQTAQRLHEPLRVVVDHARPVVRPLQITGLDRWFELYHTVSDALAQ
jgi:anti-sigma B factor antagonist